MWDLIFRPPRGRISLRRISLLVTSVMMTVFLVAGVPFSTALAASAERSGNTVSYESHTFTSIDKSASPPQMPTGYEKYDGYAYFDTADHKAYYLLTSGPADKASSAEYTIFDMPSMGSYGKPSPPTTVSIIDAATTTTTDATQTDSGTTCDSKQTGGIGWILCPVVNFLAKSMDYIYKIISNFLVVRTVTSDTNSAVYRMWTIIRDIANLCFVGVFLVIIYSQITGAGLSNYNLKKMLPRLVIGAILVNVSFWISAMAVDASNIVGYSIHDLFMTVLQNLNTQAGYENVTVPSWEVIGAMILAGGGAVGAGAFFVAANTIPGALALLMPTLVGVILAALVALIVLAARQALIICLIIISPLAFVAMLLPNTEKFFNKWRQVFTTLLLLFPIFSVIFSGAQLAGMAIIQTAGGNIVTIILGMAVQVAPIVVTPMLVKFSGGLIGRIAGMVNNPNKGLIDRTRNWSKGYAGERRDRALAGRRMPDGTFQPRGRHAMTRAIDTRRRAREGRRKAYEGLADARFAGTRQGHDIEALTKHAANEKKHHENTFAASRRGQSLELRSRNLGVDQKQIENSMMASAEGQRLRRREMDAETQKKRVETRFLESTQGQHATFRSRMADVQQSQAENRFEQTTMGERLDTAKRSVERTKQTIAAEHELRWNNRNLTDSTARALELNLDQTKREAERAKQQLSADLEHEWHFRNLNDSGSQTREMNLRIATDRAALGKAKIDATYAELKTGDASTLNAAIATATKDALAQAAQTTAESASLTQMRTNMAANELKTKINETLLTNGAEYQLDINGNKVLGTDGKPIVISNRLIDGKSIQAYAAGVGKQSNVLATAIAEDRADWGKQAQAAGELIAHFKLDSNQVQDIAAKGAGTKVKVTDDHGNEYEFDAGDEYAKEAAISKQFKEGSYGQKMAILMETGDSVEEVDPATGATIIRKGHNYAHRATAKSDAVASGIARLAPFINDVTYNEVLLGHINGPDDLKMHAMRQIFEGRIKADNLAGANNEALDIITSIGALKNSTDPADQAQFDRYKDKMFDLYARMYGQGSPKYNELAASFDTTFDENYDVTLETYRDILNNTNLSRETSSNSRASMSKALRANGYTYDSTLKEWSK